MTAGVRVGILAIAIATTGGCYQGAPSVTDPAPDEGLGDESGEQDSDSDEDGDRLGLCAPTRSLLRLSSYEYAATLEAMLGSSMISALAGVLAIIPQDRQGSAYDKEGQDLTLQHVRSYFQVAELVGQRLEDDAELRAELRPCLAEPDTSCIREFVEDAGPRILRRPLTPDDTERWMELAAMAPDPVEGLADVVAAMLQSPSFILHVELGDDPEPVEGEIMVSSHELANRLAYALTGAPPDDLLFAAARDEALSSSLLEEHATRLMETEAARTHVLRFLRQWLAVDMMPDLENPPEYIKGDLDLTELNDAAVAEIDGVLEHVVFEQGGGYADLLQTRYSVLQADSLASLYGLEEAPVDPIELGPERAGVLTRAAYLGDAAGVANPIIRGADVIDRFTCFELAPPVDLSGEDLEEPPVDPESTTRERYAAKTSGPDCAFCHQKINPYGFVLEGYDGMGRKREYEQVLSPEGEILAELPIDDTAEVELDGRPRTVDGAAELSEALASSTDVAECFTEQWLAFTEGVVDASNAECQGAPFSGLASGDLRAAIIAYVTSPVFGRRVVAMESE